MARLLGSILVIMTALLFVGTTCAESKGDDACCATSTGKSAHSHGMCADFGSLGVNAGQKAKLKTWQADCMKAGCTKESRSAFLNKAKGILSAGQYSKLKAECEKSAKKTEA
jgi:hypothetical protein